MKTGFVPALGTPLDKNGNLVADSYVKQIEMMIGAGAVGLLSMGSMGQQAFIKSSVCPAVARTAVEAAAGRIPVYVGVMDNGIVRVKERIAAMEDLDITGFVLTTPYYEIDNDGQVLKYFRSAAESTKHGIVLYDLPGVTNYKITYRMVCAFHESTPNFIGIKSADLYMIRKIRLNPDLADITTFYSGMDAFDIVYPWGIGNILDGMLPCTPVNTSRLIRAMEAGDRTSAAEALDHILMLRDLFLETDLWPSFSAAMNLLGCEGNFAPDWAQPVSDATLETIRSAMERIREL